MDEQMTSGASGIRPPQSRLPQPGSKLHELSASESNVRTAMAPPPVTTGQKHTIGGLPEPANKQRKITGQQPQPPRSMNGSIKGSSLSSLSNKQFSSSTIYSRQPSHSKSNSNHTFSYSTNGIGRPASVAAQPRPGSAFGHSRANSVNSTVRAATAMGHRGGINVSQSASAQKSKSPFSLPNGTLSMFKLRQQIGSQNSSTMTSRSASASTASASSRNSSFSSDAAQRSFSQPYTMPISLQEAAVMERKKQPRVSSLRAAFGRMRLSNEYEREPEVAGSKEDEARPPRTPNLPSRIPTASPARPGSPTKHTPVSSYTPTQTPTQTMFSASVPASRGRTTAKTPGRASSPTKPPRFLSKSSNLRAPIDNWDGSGVEAKLENMENMFQAFKSQMEGTTFERSHMKEAMELMRTRLAELEAIRNQLNSTIDTLRGENEESKLDISVLKVAMEDARRQHEIEVDDMERKHRYDLEELQNEHRTEIDRLRRNANDEEESVRRQAREDVDRLLRKHREELEQLERHYKAELAEERTRRTTEVQELIMQRDMQLQNVAVDIGKKEREAEAVKLELSQKQLEVEREKMLNGNLETKLAEIKTDMMVLDSSNAAMKAKIDFLESDNQAQSQAFADLHKRMQEAIDAAQVAQEKLRAEETLRRKLHNQVQELKGNIRVFCRVRPPLPEEDEETAKVKYPDACEGGECREVVVSGPEQKSSLGNITTASHAFSFDRVFGPTSGNGDVFEEISQLVQSALDGYNVCIFCYGQTGSGKTYTMSAEDGMIPRATAQIYESAKALEEKGWSYKMEGSFVEVYNENLNDLLGKAEDFDKKKHEIRHDTTKCKTTITDISTVTLSSADAVKEALRRADKNRSVAATKANQRSSRSHSVFILSLAGENCVTGERSEGTLNLVDLAGSERLSHSQAEGQRLKETQNINKSLSCLGDVIGALGRGDAGHVPYRNSKLTYLLQYSLGGNSKTLMFVMISPLQAHLSETLTSLKFATKVHNTHIGIARKQTRVKD